MEALSGHQESQLVAVQFAGRICAHQFAVAHHADAVCHFHYFIQTMADKHHANAGRFQFVNHLQQAIDLLTGQRGGGFIHNHQTRIGGNRPANGDQLSISNREFFYFFIGIDIHPDTLHGGQRLLFHSTTTYPDITAGQIAVNRNIFCDAKVGEQRQVLVDNLNAIMGRELRRQVMEQFSVE